MAFKGFTFSLAAQCAIATRAGMDPAGKHSPETLRAMRIIARERLEAQDEDTDALVAAMLETGVRERQAVRDLRDRLGLEYADTQTAMNRVKSEDAQEALLGAGCYADEADEAAAELLGDPTDAELDAALLADMDLPGECADVEPDWDLH